MTPSPVNPGWDHWSHQQQPHNGYMMENSGYPQYDARVVTSAPLVAPTMAPQYVPAPQYGMSALPSREPHYASHGHYSYHPYEQTHHGMPMHYSRYTPPEDRTIPPVPQHAVAEHRQQLTAPPTPIQEHKRRSPSAKREAISAHKTPDPMNAKDITFNKPARPEEIELIEFKTPIDIMMKAIQGKESKDTTTTASIVVPESEDVIAKVEATSPSASSESASEPVKTKKYGCPFEGCNKSFSQSTHLETHKRAHTGEKPYACEWPGCGRSFSQPGNLKTHKRLHTGERPFSCEQCDATFAQRGNLTAHLATHSKTKPFVCQLDGCNKCFTTRGNLKNHQNKYHKQTIQKLVDWIVSLTDVETLSPKDRELLWYFSNIYKNSNKGIKGRGRDRRVSGVRLGKKSLRDTMPHNKMMMMSSQLDVMGY